MSLNRNPSIFYGMGRKKRRGRPHRRGAGFFSAIGNALSSANDFLKKNKIISTVGNALGNTIPIAGTIGRAAATLGYGRRRRRVVRRRTVRRRPLAVGGRRRRGGRHRRSGAGLFSALRKAHDFLKSKKIISTVGNALGSSIPLAGKIGSVAGNLGYGRRRRVVRRRRVMRHHGGANFFSTEMIARPRF